MHDTQIMAVLVMCALEFEYQLALGLGISVSRSTFAQAFVRTDVCARNFGLHYHFEEIEVVCCSNMSDCHVLHNLLCFLLQRSTTISTYPLLFFDQ